ncbi:MAG: hypothetical protein OEY84_07110 [Rhodospirillaceae bacterium]|nr:hypothetical protein [Rhodospirillaceae bacterium]
MKNINARLGIVAVATFVFILTGCAVAAKKDVVSERAKIIADELPGKPAPWVSEHLGQPFFKRLEGSAELWQYKTSECILNIFIYQDFEGEQRRVLHFDARDLKGKPTGRDGCINSI